MQPTMNQAQSKIENICVTSVEKRKVHGNKNFEFVLRVRWSNGNEHSIFRQYSMFFDLQSALKLILQDKYHVTIPDLPVPKFHGRAMLFSSLAKKECKVVEEFCQKIIRLPSAVSQSDIVLRFFSEWGTDASLNSQLQNQSANARPNLVRSRSNPDKQSDVIVEKYRSVAQYVASSSGEMSLENDEVVTVIEKNQTGWWFVTNDKGQHGFAPATFLDPLDPGRESEAEEWVEYDGESRMWLAKTSYKAQSEDEVSYEKGEEMEVIATSTVGWWKVRCNGKVGVTPASNLKPKEQPQDEDEDEYATIRDISRRASFTSASPIYASIRRPPPRRDSSKKDAASRPPPVVTNDIETLEYAIVDIAERLSPTNSPGREDVREIPEYATVLPKHLRPKRPSSSSSNQTFTQLNDDTDPQPTPPPMLPELHINPFDDRGTDEPSVKRSLNQRSRSQDDDTSTHGYLNVAHGLEIFADLYETMTSYKAPDDRPEDLTLEEGIFVRVLSRDGPFYFVSTLESPSRQGWVPDYVLRKKIAKSDSAQRRSHSVSDIRIQCTEVELESVRRIHELHTRAPLAVPRTLSTQSRLTVRHHSFDVASLTPDSPPYVPDVPAFQPEDSAESDHVWFYGKMTRQACEETMIKYSRELEFLVRESTQKFASYVLSVKYAGKIRHFPVEVTQSKKFVIGKHAFNNLQEVIEFYKIHPLFYTQHKNPVSLGMAFRMPRT